MKEKFKKTILSLIAPHFKQPIFLLSAPRSGSSYFYEIVRRLGKVWSCDRENDPLWFQFFPYSRLAKPTDYISATECTPKIVGQFKQELLYQGIQIRRQFRYQDIQKHLFQRQPIRYLEKTIANCFHLAALQKMFPDALYIYIIRDGRACISSMLEGWQSDFFWHRPLPFPENATISYWCYPIPPNWETVVGKSLPEICAWSWQQHNQFVLTEIQNNPNFAQNCLQIYYEDLLQNPQNVLSQVSEFTHLPITPETQNYLAQKQTSWTTLSQPQAEKWRKKNGDAIAQILPQIQPLMQQLGYHPETL
ncbi:MAG: sulfotransferase [Jaaginema sp. PMC 1079.18]|nr:sulfotransferase [Jaaginema sp. PMC 1080.18]MEC4851924.1 sulfotransferase [Jaaginema sp. PMC 1079.18]MEC4865551.1 sulfotransferase [Jaaginema sp. PMC 1078.18]